MSFFSSNVRIVVLMAVVLLSTQWGYAFEESHDATSDSSSSVASEESHRLRSIQLAGRSPPLSGVTFLLFAFVVVKLGVFDGIANAIFSSVQGHEEKEVQALQNAEKLTAEANKILTANRGRWEALEETVQNMMAEARRDADHATRQILDAASSESSALMTRANAEISRNRDHSLHEIFSSLADKVVAAAETNIKQKLEDNTQQTG